jgi:hypothetical protein
MRTTAIVLLVVACSNETPPPPGTPEPASALTGTHPKGMRRCPSAVPGASTRAVDTEEGVDVVVTATSPDAQREILARARDHQYLGNPGRLTRHDGTHSGPGTLGFCPIIHANTLITVADAPDGVVIHVTTTDASKRQALQRATARRVAKLREILPTS